LSFLDGDPSDVGRLLAGGRRSERMHQERS
jgi:hypothetical protein